MAENQKPEDMAADKQPDIKPRTDHPAPVNTGVSRLQRFKIWYAARKKWTIPASVLLFILILAAIPFTRYSLAGLVIKHDVTIKVMDASADTPVSGATLSAGSISAETDSNGKATLRHLKAGHHKVILMKKYYKDGTIDVLSPLFGHTSTSTAELTATGRQVKITITNLINKKVLADVDIKVAGTSAKTDQTGSALVVLPANGSEQTAQLSADGFNDATVTIKLSNGQLQNDAFSMVPAGKVYFLSKLSGKIDVVKTNLDGSDRQTVLAGTGKEDDQNTVLLASRDWKYLALLSARAGGNYPSLYLIDTANNDKLTTIDKGDTNLSLIGWSDNYFLYTIGRQNLQPWQPGGSNIKSFNAQTKQLLTLDSTNATGSSLDDAQYETVGTPVLLDDQLLYYKTWYQYPGYFATGHTDTLVSIKPDGTNKKTIKSFDGGDSYFGGLIFHNPQSVYVDVSKVDGSSQTFYEYNGTGLNQNKNLSSQDLFIKSYPTYLYSPGGDHTFWNEPRDGKNTLFIGDKDGQNGKQIATLSDYNTYGWFTDDYLLVSKNSSELYIMDNSAKQAPVKISDYHKASVSLPGYGGGYGGF